MHKFAHMADIHLGAHREPTLQKLEADAFRTAMDKCIHLGMDFILICGDFFHVGIPDLSVVNEALLKIRDVQKAGIPIYVIYGSHDYTPNGTSVIDILDTAGVLTKIVKLKTEDKVRLDFFEDRKTGAKLAGISARKIGLERKYYEMLDKENLEKEDGFKIFAFHSAITELKPEYLSEMESIPISSFPKGFDYYAGGHIHQRGEFNLPSYRRIIFPGPLFTGHGRDLEVTAKGEERGFYIISFNEKVRNIEFQAIKNFEGIYQEYDATDKNSLQVDREIKQLFQIDVKGKVVVLKVRGELSGGKVSDIDFLAIKANLLEKGALYIHLNRYGLISREFPKIIAHGEEVSAIESRVLKEKINQIKVSEITLKDPSVAMEVLKIIRQEQKSNESKREYQERMVRSAIGTLRLEEVFDK
ncbi:MAG: exonuclease SbcCD subunit D [Thaumarchaeota archaeon]|nr:exonuclease SbcCD subunit D [Nitrososphaerota archaeon]